MIELESVQAFGKFEVMDEATNRVIFICTGNHYRSRLSEELFNFYARHFGLAWEAHSRGLIDTGELKGISPFAWQYLIRRGLSSHIDPNRNPQILRVADFEWASLLIALNREEHEPMLRDRFGQIPKILAQKNQLRFWNVCDVPGDQNSLGRLFGVRNTRATQSPASGTEHIDFAIQSLIRELQAHHASLD